MDRKPRQPTQIRAWRLARGMSLEALGHAIGMAKGNLSKMERGINPYTQDAIERIAAELDVTPAELLARRPSEAPQLWTLLDRAPDEIRMNIVAVAETMLNFRPGTPLSEVLDTSLSAPTARSSSGSRKGRALRSH